MMMHVIKNDSRYLRSWLIFWGALLLMPLLAIAGLHSPLGWDPGYWSTLQFGLFVLFLIQFVTQVLLVAKLVQKENLKDGRAYWRTRPIPRGQLVGAKLALTVFWLLLPQLVQASLMMALLQREWRGGQLLRDLGQAGMVGRAGWVVAPGRSRRDHWSRGATSGARRPGVDRRTLDYTVPRNPSDERN